VRFPTVSLIPSLTPTLCGTLSRATSPTGGPSSGTRRPGQAHKGFTCLTWSITVD
jgi:hypothetical protein